MDAFDRLQQHPQVCRWAGSARPARTRPSGIRKNSSEKAVKTSRDRTCMGVTTGGDASDRERFAQIYQRHYASVHAYVARRLRSRELADDVTAEVFTVAWRRLDDIPSPIGGWLFGVARNVVMATNRATPPDPIELVEEALSAREGDPSARAIDRAELDRVARALSTLSASDQELLLLVAWEGLPLSQLAEALECSAAAAGVRLHRARQRLRRAVDTADGRSVPGTLWVQRARRERGD